MMDFPSQVFIGPKKISFHYQRPLFLLSLRLSATGFGVTQGITRDRYDVIRPSKRSEAWNGAGVLGEHQS